METFKIWEAYDLMDEYDVFSGTLGAYMNTICFINLKRFVKDNPELDYKSIIKDCNDQSYLCPDHGLLGIFLSIILKSQNYESI